MEETMQEDVLAKMRAQSKVAFERLVRQFGSEDGLYGFLVLSSELSAFIYRFKLAWANEEQFIATADEMSKLKAAAGMLGINEDNFSEMGDRALRGISFDWP